MAQNSFHGIANNWFAQLNAAIDASQTTIVLKGAPSDYSPDEPFYVDVGTEAMRVTNIAVDTPSADLDTFTVSRGEMGTSATTHAADDWAQQHNYDLHTTEIQSRLAALERLVADAFGGGNGVFLTAAEDELEVVAQSTPDMTVKVKAGSFVASGQPGGLGSDTNSAAVAAPTSNPRIDVVETAVNAKTGETEINIVTGTEAASPSAPAVTSGALKEAEIYCRVGMTSIKDADDSTNGYITDYRTIMG